MAKILMGDQMWPMWIFGLGAFILVMIVTLTMVTIRAFQLQEKKLLDSDIFLFSHDITFPIMMAGFTELMLFLSGCLIFAITGSSFTFVSMLLLPPIVGLIFSFHPPTITHPHSTAYHLSRVLL